MSDRKNAVAVSAVAEEISDRLAVSVSKAAVFEVLKMLGDVVSEHLEKGDSVMLHNVGVIKPTTIKGREYPNPRGGEPQVKPDRRSIRIDIALPLKRRFGRA